jgi:L-threonylcarbamoyladenylate synthase
MGQKGVKCAACKLTVHRPVPSEPSPTQASVKRLMLTAQLQSQIDTAAAILRSGGVVGIPTETVYGLAADAANADAVKRIFTIKGRPADHPLIVHIADASQLGYWARDIPDSAKLLARHFWPGPLTLILSRSAHVPDVITGGQDSVGLRVPDHPVALALLRAMGAHGGLAAPSANRYGRISPTTAAHVRDELGDTVDMILDGGPCQVGLESTIVSCIGDSVTVLRPGGIPVSAIEKLLQHRVEVVDSTSAKIRVSGSVLSHYAPRTPLELVPHKDLWQRACELNAQGLRVATLEWSTTDDLHLKNAAIVRTAMPAHAETYAQRLYATLRQLDNAHFDRLLAETPPHTVEWLAVADRLKRASHKD